MLKTKLLLLISAALLVATPAARGEWVDDWLDQRTSTSPGYFKGQKRGYYTGGSFSGRWYSSNDYLLSASAPRVKGGCGGIDVFGGSLSYLDADMIVNKLEAMLQNAGGVIFDMALSTFCEPCSSALKTMESLAQQFNSLQFDDCAAAKKMVAYVTMPDGKELRGLSDIKNSLVTDSASMFSRVRDNQAASGAQQQTSDSTLIAGCPADVQDALAIFTTPDSTILEVIGEMKGYPPEYMDMARGFVGDVAIESVDIAGGGFNIVHNDIAPCGENKSFSLDNFLSGNAWSRPANGGGCFLPGAGAVNLYDWVAEQYQDVSAKLSARGNLSATEEAFINATPLPVYKVMKVGLSEDTLNYLIPAMTDITARAFAYGMMSDLYEMTLDAVQMANALTGSAKDKLPPECNVEHLTIPATNKINKLAGNLFEYIRSIQSEYARTVRESDALIRVSKAYDSFEKEAFEALNSVVSKAVAGRAMNK